MTTQPPTPSEPREPGGSDPGAPGPGVPEPGTPEPGAPGPDGREHSRDLRQLRRSVTDRKLAGVAGGLGRFLDVDPLIFRVLFVVFTPFGGLGLLLYGILWLLVPEEGQESSEGQNLVQGRTSNQAIWAVCAAICGFVLFVAIAASRWDVALWLFAIGAVVYLVSRDREGNRIFRSNAPAPGPPGYPGAGYGGSGYSGGYPGAGAAGSAPAATPTAPGASGYATFQPGGAAPTATGTTSGGYPTGGYPPGGPPGGPPAWGYVPPVPRPPVPKEPKSALPWLTGSLALLGAGVLAALDAADQVNVPARVVLATALVVIGAGLLVGTWFGRGRSLISIGLIAALALFTVSALRVPLRGGVGDVRYAPRTVAEAERPHQLAVGKMVLDLRELDPKGQTVRINGSLGIGQTIVCLPTTVPSQAEADVGMGDVNNTMRGAHQDGEHISYQPSGIAVRDGRVELSLKQGIGEIVFTEGVECETSSS